MRRLHAALLTIGLAAPALAHLAPASAEETEVQAKTGIAWQVSPEQVIIFLDDKKLGTAGQLKFTDAKPGKHTVRLVRGKDETEMDVNVKKGEALSFVYQFED